MVTIKDFGDIGKALNEKKAEKKSETAESKKEWVIHIGEEYELTPSLRLKVKANDPDTELITMESNTGKELVMEATPLSNFLEEAEELYETEHDTKDDVDAKISLLQGTLKRTKDNLKKRLLELKIDILKEVSEEFDNSEDEETDEKNVPVPQSANLPLSSKQKIRFTSTDPYNLGPNNKFYRKTQDKKKEPELTFARYDQFETKDGEILTLENVNRYDKGKFLRPDGKEYFKNKNEVLDLIASGDWKYLGPKKSEPTKSTEIDLTNFKLENLETGTKFTDSKGQTILFVGYDTNDKELGTFNVNKIFQKFKESEVITNIKSGEWKALGEIKIVNKSNPEPVSKTPEELEIEKLEKRLEEIKLKRAEIAQKIAKIDAELNQIKNEPAAPLATVKKEKIKEDTLGIAAGVGSMGKGIIETLFKQLFESLKKGSAKMAGIDEPILLLATPYFKKGLIKNQGDLQKFYDIETTRKNALASIKKDDVNRNFYVELPKNKERGKMIIFKDTIKKVQEAVNKNFDKERENAFGKLML